MQLPPTVLSDEADFNGLGTSMFARLVRKAGMDPCMLKLQYRMHESICKWPSDEFYDGKLRSRDCVRMRDPVQGFPWPSDSALASRRAASSTGSKSSDTYAKWTIDVNEALHV